MSDEPKLLGNIRIVMVETTLAANIGSAARAMKTMGLSDLVLVKPKSVHTEEAYARASGAIDIMDNLKVVDSLSEAVSDCGFVMGSSARIRGLPWPLINPREAAEEAVLKGPDKPVALVFGRESSGLSNEELAQCHRHVHIPANPEYSSLNVASAIQILAYECRMAALGASAFEDKNEQREAPIADHESMEGFIQHLQQTLVDIQFLDPNNPKLLMTRLRRLYLRAELDQTEINILRGILKSTQKLKDG